MAGERERKTQYGTQRAAKCAGWDVATHPSCSLGPNGRDKSSSIGESQCGGAPGRARSFSAGNTAAGTRLRPQQTVPRRLSDRHKRKPDTPGGPVDSVGLIGGGGQAVDVAVHVGVCRWGDGPRHPPHHPRNQHCSAPHPTIRCSASGCESDQIRKVCTFSVRCELSCVLTTCHLKSKRIGFHANRTPESVHAAMVLLPSPVIHPSLKRLPFATVTVHCLCLSSLNRVLPESESVLTPLARRSPRRQPRRQRGMGSQPQ